jgi:hypothetical protein
MQFFEVIVERISYILQLQAYRPGMMSQLFAQIYRASCSNAHVGDWVRHHPRLTALPPRF